MKRYGQGILTGVVLSIIIGLIGRNYFVKKEIIPDIQIIKEKVEDTKWKDKYLKLKLEASEKKNGMVITPENTFDNLVACVSSDISATSTIKDNTLVIDIEDLCKETQLKINLKTYIKYRHIFQGGLSYINELGPGYEVSYLYGFKYFAIGGGVSFNKSFTGAKVLVQIPISL